MEITKIQYEYALERIEDLLPLVKEDTPADDRNAVELEIVSDIVEQYEKIHFPIEKPSVGELISLSIEENEKYINDMTKEQNIKNQVDFSRYLGHQDGLAEGIETERAKIAKNMLDLGIDEEVITQVTELSLQQLAALKDNK